MSRLPLALFAFALASPATAQLSRVGIALPGVDGGPPCRVSGHHLVTEREGILEISGDVALECSGLFVRMDRVRIELNLPGNRTGADRPAAIGTTAFTFGDWLLSGEGVRCTAASASACLNLAAGASRRLAPDFTLTDSTGQTVRLSGLKGRVVAIDFWATWCAGCRQQIPWLMEFQKRYEPEGLITIGVALDEEGWTKVRPYIGSLGLNYTVVIGTKDTVREYGIVGLPVTILIDRSGRIANAHVGVLDKDAWEAEIQELLRESQ